MRAQNRLFSDKREWLVEASWGYGPGVPTWAQAVGHPVSRRWLAMLDRGTVRSVRLQVFLRWVRRQSAAEPANSASSTAPGTGVCCACLTVASNIAIAPCGHISVCLGCIESLVLEGGSKCPICRGPIESYLRVYVS